MEKEKNFILKMVTQNLKVNIYITIELKVIYIILMENWNSKENLDIIENGMEKAMMKMVM